MRSTPATTQHYSTTASTGHESLTLIMITHYIVDVRFTFPPALPMTKLFPPLRTFQPASRYVVATHLPEIPLSL